MDLAGDARIWHSQKCVGYISKGAFTLAEYLDSVSYQQPFSDHFPSTARSKYLAGPTTEFWQEVEPNGYPGQDTKGCPFIQRTEEGACRLLAPQEWGANVLVLLKPGKKKHLDRLLLGNNLHYFVLSWPYMLKISSDIKELVKIYSIQGCGAQ